MHLITGKELNFKFFSETSALLGVVGDAEGAQAQGFGDMVLKRRLNNPSKSGIFMTSADEVICHLWKTCTVHFDRGVFALGKGGIPPNITGYLLNFPKLERWEDIESYYAQCDYLATFYEKIKGWWDHKKSYPWLLPSLNRCLSKMRPEHWDLIPSNTNQIEGSHANDNQVMETNHPLLEAILLAKKADDEVSRIINLSLTSGVLPNQYTSSQSRYASQNQRKASSRLRQARTNADKEKALSIKKHIKDLQAQLKEIEPSKTTRKQLRTSKQLTSTQASVMNSQAATERETTISSHSADVLCDVSLINSGMGHSMAADIAMSYGGASSSSAMIKPVVGHFGPSSDTDYLDAFAYDFQSSLDSDAQPFGYY